MTKALELLAASLAPPKHELNELDWKAALSPDKSWLTERLNQAMPPVAIIAAAPSRRLRACLKSPLNRGRLGLEFRVYAARGLHTA